MPPKNTPPGLVPKEALDYFKAKGLKPSFNYGEVWREEHSAAFTVAKIMELDVLATVRGIVERAIEGGTTFEQFQQDVGPLLDKSGWSDYHKETPTKHRLQIIYDTNMRTARVAGQWQRFERTKDLLPFLQYGATSSLRPRETHQGWIGLILRIDNPFWDYALPPSEWLCKHTVRQIGNAEASRKGGEGKAPPKESVEWTLPNGKTEMVPKGVHPAFNYNPGKNRTAGLDAALIAAEAR